MHVLRVYTTMCLVYTCHSLFLWEEEVDLIISQTHPLPQKMPASLPCNWCCRRGAYTFSHPLKSCCNKIRRIKINKHDMKIFIPSFLALVCVCVCVFVCSLTMYKYVQYLSFAVGTVWQCCSPSCHFWLSSFCLTWRKKTLVSPVIRGNNHTYSIYIHTCTYIRSMHTLTLFLWLMDTPAQNCTPFLHVHCIHIIHI